MRMSSWLDREVCPHLDGPVLGQRSLDVVVALGPELDKVLASRLQQTHEKQ